MTLLEELDDARAQVVVASEAIFGSEESEPVTSYALVAAWQEHVAMEVELTGTVGDVAFDTGRSLGRLLAAKVHLEALSNYESARESTTGGDVLAAEAAHDEFVDLLRLTHAAALGVEPRLAEYALSPRLDSVAGLVNAALLGSGIRDTPDAIHRHAVTCHLARRLAALASFLPTLICRLHSTRLRKSTAAIASRRETLTAHAEVHEPWVSDLSGASPGDRIILATILESGQLIDVPEKPYTKLATSSGDELRVHYKNSHWTGVARDQAIVVKCKAEPPDGEQRYAVAEFEGPSTTSGTVWESWIQAEASDRYRIGPESVHWYVAFAAATSALARLDFYSRITAGDPS